MASLDAGRPVVADVDVERSRPVPPAAGHKLGAYVSDGTFLARILRALAVLPVSWENLTVGTALVSSRRGALVLGALTWAAGVSPRC